MIYWELLNRFYPQYSFALSAIIFVPTFEFLRVYGNYEIRTAFMCAIGVIFFSWQIMMLRRKRNPKGCKKAPKKCKKNLNCLAYYASFIKKQDFLARFRK